MTPRMIFADDLFFNCFLFCLNNKGDKMKRTEIIADYQDAGLKMLDIIESNKALKISWYLSIFQGTVNLNGSAFSIFVYLR